MKSYFKNKGGTDILGHVTKFLTYKNTKGIPILNERTAGNTQYSHP